MHHLVLLMITIASMSSDRRSIVSHIPSIIPVIVVILSRVTLEGRWNMPIILQGTHAGHLRGLDWHILYTVSIMVGWDFKLMIRIMPHVR